MTNLDLQLGRVEKINADGTINIFDFRTGGQVYQNVSIEHNAINQQQPVEGQHVLFATTGQGAQHLIKVVRLYGSTDADQNLVLSSPIDMDQGEGRMISQTGATVYVANGALYLASGGQTITLMDEDLLMSFLCNNFRLDTRDGYAIAKEDDGNLLITKGDSVTIKVNDKSVSITGKQVAFTIDLDAGKVIVDAQSVELNGTTPVARKGDAVKVTIPAGTNLGTPAGAGPLIIQAPLDITGTITAGSSTVKSG